MGIDAILHYESEIRLAAFAGVFGVMFVAEIFAPRRGFRHPRAIRVPSNLGLAFLNNLLLKLFFPMLAIGAAYWAEGAEWGLFHWIGFPSMIEIFFSILLLDLIIYGQHIVFHAVPFLWRLHRVHHADLDLDSSSGTRFHPFEIFISMGIKIPAVILLGASPFAVFLFELILTVSSVFNHSNINLPIGFDRILRLFIITPDMHRVHHSIYVAETNSNFGFNFPWWDRLFQTYRAQPENGHNGMLIGIELFRTNRWLYLHRLLIEPFLNRKD